MMVEAKIVAAKVAEAKAVQATAAGNAASPLLSIF
jgi:hypothetical protein